MSTDSRVIDASEIEFQLRNNIDLKTPVSGEVFILMCKALRAKESRNSNSNIDPRGSIASNASASLKIGNQKKQISYPGPSYFHAVYGDSVDFAQFLKEEQSALAKAQSLALQQQEWIETEIERLVDQYMADVRTAIHLSGDVHAGKQPERGIPLFVYDALVEQAHENFIQRHTINKSPKLGALVICRKESSPPADSGSGAPSGSPSFAPDTPPLGQEEIISLQERDTNKNPFAVEEKKDTEPLTEDTQIECETLKAYREGKAVLDGLKRWNGHGYSSSILHKTDTKANKPCTKAGNQIRFVRRIAKAGKALLKKFCFFAADDAE